MLHGLLKALALSCVRLGCAERQKGVCLEMLTIATTPPPLLPHNHHHRHVHFCTNRTLASTPHTIRELPKPGNDVQLDVVVGEGAYGKVRVMLLAPAPAPCAAPYPTLARRRRHGQGWCALVVGQWFALSKISVRRCSCASCVCRALDHSGWDVGVCVDADTDG